MYCKPQGRENTVSKDLFTISLLIASSVSWVGAGSASSCCDGLDRKGFWIVKAFKKGRSLGGGGGGGSIYIYIYIYGLPPIPPPPALSQCFHTVGIVSVS